jgi:hypothetical protein
MPMVDLAVRAEILLARGDVDAGLRLWRRAAAGVRQDTGARQDTAGNDVPGPGSWALEVVAVTVVAHAHHGSLDLVEEIVGELPRVLWNMVTHPSPRYAATFADFPVCGALLLAQAMVDIDRGERDDDARATTSGVRMVALAEYFRFVRGFQPTMSAARARDVAEQSDKSTYADAVLSYAELDREALRTAASTALTARNQFTARDPA